MPEDSRMNRMLCLAALACLAGCKPTATDTPDKSTSSRADDPFARIMEQDQAQKTPPPIDDATAAALVPPPPAAALTPKSDPASVEIKTVDFTALDNDIAALKGKVVVVDCWATWCGACKENFPKFLEIAHKHGGRDDVVFLSVANDKADDIDKAREFLAKSAATTRNFLLDEDPNDFATKFQANGVPLYLIYGKDGQILLRSNKVEELSEKLDETLSSKS